MDPGLGWILDWGGSWIGVGPGLGWILDKGWLLDGGGVGVSWGAERVDGAGGIGKVNLGDEVLDKGIPKAGRVRSEG